LDRRQRVLVTGANGFVGSHLTEALLEAGYRVRCMVRRSSDLRFVAHLPVEWAYADLGQADGEALRQACQGVDLVCHCAALTRALDKETFYRVNAGGAEALARAALEANPALERFLFVSSQAAAGPAQHADDFVDESDPPQPVDWYGQSKWAAEQALLALTSENGGGLPLTIMRPSAVFGPRDRDFLTYFRLIKHGLHLEIGRGARWLSLIYVKDLVSLLVAALESECALGQTYFARGTDHTQEEFSEAIARVLGKRPVEIRLPEVVMTPLSLWARVQGRLTGRPALLNEQRLANMRHREWLCSGEKARRELGFVAQYSLQTAVRETANWYLENGWL
jgi:nucleoside-diphosphate-sugar epimerase